jgi:hypothetical protein
MRVVIPSVIYRPPSGTHEQMGVFGLQVLTVAVLVSSGIVSEKTVVLFSGGLVFVTHSYLQFSAV